MLRLSGTSSTGSAAGTMRLKRLIKPPAQPVVLDLDNFYILKGKNLSRVSPATLKKNPALINARFKKVLYYRAPLNKICLNKILLSGALNLTIYLTIGQ